MPASRSPLEPTRRPRGLASLALALSLALPGATALAQTKAALVRDVDEPARVPFARSLAPTCPFANRCIVELPAVPAGKRLRVTNLQAIVYFAPPNGFVAINRHGPGASDSPILAFPLNAFNGAYYGPFFSLNQPLDLIFEAGDAITLEVGTGSNNAFNTDSRNRLGLTGYLVDVAP